MVDRYLKRVAWPTRMTELPDAGGRIPELSPQSRRVLLDETGDLLSSLAFADRLARWRDDGVREVRFELGAADGHDPAARAQADRLNTAYYAAARPPEPGEPNR